MFPDSVRTFSTAEDFIKALQQDDYSPEIVTVDVCFGKTDGISFAKQIVELYPYTKIIFLSDQLNYVTDVYSVKHFWFVTKTRMNECLPDVLRKAVESIRFDEKNSILIPIKFHNCFMKVPLLEICYFERQGRMTNIVTNHHAYMTNSHPDEIIPDEMKELFVHCHQSYWVNVKRIQKMTVNMFVMEDGLSIPITRTFREESRKQFLGQHF